VWTERSDLKVTWSNETYTDAYKAHKVLDNYTETERSRLGTADHVALFTGSV